MAELNAAQVAAIEEKVRLHMASAIEQMKLRQWAVEIAMKCGDGEPIGRAAAIYAFITKPALEPFKS